MIRVVQFVIQTRIHALKLKPEIGIERILYLEGYSGCIFVGDKETKKSV